METRPWSVRSVSSPPTMRPVAGLAGRLGAREAQSIEGDWIPCVQPHAGFSNLISLWRGIDAPWWLKLYAWIRIAPFAFRVKS
jgi:hypothetical protein